jgi:signal transduction histidine kinase
MPDDTLFTDWKIYFMIMFQLISNAIKFNQQDGSIQISIFFKKVQKNMLLDA